MSAEPTFITTACSVELSVKAQTLKPYRSVVMAGLDPAIQ